MKVIRTNARGSIKHNDTLNLNSNPDFLHITETEKALITSTSEIVGDHTEDISNLQADKADKATTLSGYEIEDAYTKTEIDNKISAVFRYRGSVPTYADLTALTGMTIGDVYNVTETGDNYAWTSTEWDKLAGEIDLSAYLTSDDASNTYETIANVNSLGNIVSGHTGDISNLQAVKADKATTLSGYGIEDTYTKTEIDINFENHKTHSDVTYEELLALINNNGLIPSSSYRITNYTTTTAQGDTTSAGYDFDVIVTALSNNELSEIASCVRKAGDTYFENAKLEAWEIKYCIDNDTTRFAWADSINGKGVIYYMKDEWGNECPYDFKNIQFKKSDVFLYTFGGTTDNSLTGGCHHNTMMEYTLNSVLTLNFNTFGTSCYSNTFGSYCYSNTFGTNCNYNMLDSGCYANTFGNACSGNTFGISCRINIFGDAFGSNMFGNSCRENTFGINCYYNTFGNNCMTNTFGSDYQVNTFGSEGRTNMFGDNCRTNTFGDYCSSNTFGNYSSSNKFGNDCLYNTFSTYCSNNMFGNNCTYNKFGNYCTSNTFGNMCSSNNFYAGNAGNAGTTKKDYIRYIVLEDACRYNNFYSTLTTSINNYLQRIIIKGLDNTTATNTQINLSEVNTKYEWLIYYTTAGVLKQHSPDYSLINNYTYKIENTNISTWAASTAYAGYDYQAQINISNLTENDNASVIFDGADVISGNYYPIIQIYEGYILIFSKVNATITIPTIEITKIDL